MLSHMLHQCCILNTGSLDIFFFHICIFSDSETRRSILQEGQSQVSMALLYKLKEKLKELVYSLSSVTGILE